ncbi:CHAT domain-containing protein [Aetokthonos hydrillicola Thurmond2011]|jgi:WD40 repeat protein|uniref:CHAT domain-containing protein n=1 Tax=Aetokthonos hydrillicola Thurmond2011 TaxID=2712845 RepID=A0AAP5MCP0_9CYAN|nr:CHAT domain-containing protein [Aetokthonos hydrillicola]MBO3459546.1 CHAT domain-containing protein [Aetokthonos hydrillicola CCALA 1050]MBW4590295.1 CHAT domain-containing protein [Aetokthonos hydrillicola CCALA 1050]MDR9899417.1 CHAT domain-containing protein [Aetokthonos hydrillicola Thurmond2011]
MTKLIVLKLDGTLQSGVRVSLSMNNEGVNPHKEVTGYLPPVPDLETTIDQWRSNYRSLGNTSRALKAKKVTYDDSISQKYNNCKNSATELQKHLNGWLRSESFRPIRETWLKELKENDSARILIRTSNHQLRQIPWQVWDLVEEYPYTELALSAPDYQQLTLAKTPTKRDKVKILAILGNSMGIDVETDRKLLNSLPDADVTFLVQPQRHEINDSLWEQRWDILFFAGHSETVGDSGRIYINEQKESLSTDDLKYGLKKATSNGLALAIFNSCDGLGLAYELEALHIPQIVVMREPVPDEVAQIFLKHFLVAYATSGKSLYQAIKEARLKLHGLEDKYPCASLLPVICQNGGAIPPTWLDLGRRPTEISPYQGLFAFKEDDAQFFFGRESFTKMLVEAVRSQSLVAVIGPSGSGKSSVVFAGLVKCLRDTGDWHIIDFRPGSRPLFALATALVSYKQAYPSRTERLRDIRNLASDLGQCENGLRDMVDDILFEDPRKRLLLVADQFEELYTLCRDLQERKAFLDGLLSAIQNCQNFTFVITLRADFLGQALSYRPFADALQYADLKLAPMADSELQAAVEKPASLLGVTIESGLTERIVSAVSAEPGDLPLLEFALTQLWAKQLNGQLTHSAYDEIGGVEAALARYADEVYSQLNFDDKPRAQQIFIQLVHPGLGTEDTRRVATRLEIGEENWDLVTRLASSRLVVTGRDEKSGVDTVEFVHEALIRSWGQLQQWMQVDRDFRHWQEQSRVAMRIWESSGFDEGALLRGKPLVDAEDWLLKRSMELSSQERSFIGLSLELRSQQSKNQKRRRQFIISGLSSSLVVALLLAGLAWWQEQNARISEIKAIAASSQLLLTSHQDFDALIASLKASRKWNQIPSSLLLFPGFKEKAEIERSLNSLLQEAVYKVREINRLEKHTDEVIGVSFSPDRQMIATVSKDKNVKLWSLDGKQLTTLKGHKDLVGSVNFSPDGQLLATASWDGTAKLWTREGKELKTFIVSKGDKKKIFGISFSPDGQLLATGSEDGTVQVWNLEGKIIKTIIKAHDGLVLSISFSPDGRLLATAGSDNTAKLWSLDGKKITSFPHKNWVRDVSFSPDGKIIATASKDTTVKLWSLDGKQLDTLKGTMEFTSVKFSPNGKILAATSTSDNNVHVWSLDHFKKPEKIQTLSGHKDWVWNVSFSPDSEAIATASKDKTVKIWRLRDKELQFLPDDNIYVGTFNQSDGKIATANINNTAKIWSRDGEELQHFTVDNQITTMSFSPDSQKIVTAQKNGTVTLWNNNGQKIRALCSHKDAVNQVSFSPNGKMIATASADKTVNLCSQDGKKIATLEHNDPVNSVSFSPDGRLLASASWDWSIKLWTSEGKLIKTLDDKNGGHKDGVYSVSFSPNGKIIATASEDKTVKLWTNDGNLLKTIKVHDAGVYSVRFSPDGKKLATASADKTIKIWKLEDKELKELKTFRTQDALVFNISFSPDGHTLAFSDQTGRFIFWDLDLTPDDLLKRGCDKVRDYLNNNSNVSESDRHLCDDHTSEHFY